MTEKNPREALFKELKALMDVSHKKFHRKKKKDEGLQIRWGNLLLKAINTYGSLLETEELELRVEKLEEQFKDAVVIPSEKH